MNANELTKTLRWLAKETEFIFAAESLMGAADLIEDLQAEAKKWKERHDKAAQNWQQENEETPSDWTKNKACRDAVLKTFGGES